MIVSKKQTLLRSLLTLVTVSLVGSLLPQGQAQTLDLREGSSIFSRSSGRDRTLTRQAQQAKGTQNGQSQQQQEPQAAPETEQKLGVKGEEFDNRVRATESITPSGSSETPLPTSVDDGLTAARPPENLADQVPLDAIPSTTDVSPLEQSPETPLILPLPIWEQQRQVQAQAQQTTSASTPAIPPAPQPSSNYVLVPSDYVQITVFQENDLATDTRISQDGTINFPLIGVTKIGGKTVNEAVELIRQRLNADFLVNPQVNLTIIQYSRGRFTILGEVSRPGTYDLPQEDTVTLLDAIGSAGGFTRTARTTKVTIKRNVNGKEEIINLDAKKMAREGVQPFIVRPGDTITVPTTFF